MRFGRWFFIRVRQWLIIRAFSVSDPDGIEVEFTYHPPMMSTQLSQRCLVNDFAIVGTQRPLMHYMLSKRVLRL